MPSNQHPPSVDRLARSMAMKATGLPHPMLVTAARQAIAAKQPETAEAIAKQMAKQLLRPVINGTGTLLHTNLGRAPVSHSQPEQYTNLEFNLTTGERGSRSKTTASLIAQLCGAEAGLVVNNCAAAMLLCLASLADGKGVLVSRGELIEIGGGFRIPEVMERSGARLIEVGTTNRTRTTDFQRAIALHGDDAAAVLKVHQSNYKIVGFSEAPRIEELATLGLPLIVDIGSGLVDSRCQWLAGDPPVWLEDEPAACQTLRVGADLVLFSGDKLFGGPQAGIIVGRADLVAKCSKHPLARALRPGAMLLGALQNTALAYLNRDGNAIGFWRMATVSQQTLRSRAEAICGKTPMDGTEARSGNTRPALHARPVDLESTPGGGTLPGVEIPSAGLAINGDKREALRNRDRPIIARVTQGQTLIDLRTVDPKDDLEIQSALSQLN